MDGGARLTAALAALALAALAGCDDPRLSAAVTIDGSGVSLRPVISGTVGGVGVAVAPAIN